MVLSIHQVSDYLLLKGENMNLLKKFNYSDPMTNEIIDEMIDAQTIPMSINQSNQIWSQLNNDEENIKD